MLGRASFIVLTVFLAGAFCASSTSSSPSCNFVGVEREFYTLVNLEDGETEMVINNTVGNYTIDAVFGTNNRLLVFVDENPEPGRAPANQINVVAIDLDTYEQVANFIFAGVPGTTVMTSLSSAVIPGASREWFVVEVTENRYVDSYNQVMMASVFAPENNDTLAWGGSSELVSTFNYNFYPQKSLAVGGGVGTINFQIIQSLDGNAWNTYAVKASRTNFESVMNNSVHWSEADSLTADSFASLVDDTNEVSILSFAQNNVTNKWSATLWGMSDFFATGQTINQSTAVKLTLPTTGTVTIQRAILVESTWQVMVIQAGGPSVNLYLLEIDATTGNTTQYGPYKLPNEEGFKDVVYTDFMCTF